MYLCILKGNGLHKADFSKKKLQHLFLIIIIPCTLPMVPVGEVTVGKGVELAIELADEREG